MQACHRLSFKFDPDLLQRDLTALVQESWVGHEKRYHYAGDWSAIALRSRSGQSEDLSPGSGRKVFQDTPLLSKASYIRDYVLSQFHCPIRRVRLMRLLPGSQIHEHIDSYQPVLDKLRLHIPIVTNDAVEFRVAGHPVSMRPGECWYLDVNAPHAVRNGGAVDRVHLVIDGEINDWWRSHLPIPLPGDQWLWRSRFRLRALRYRWRDKWAASRLTTKRQHD